MTQCIPWYAARQKIREDLSLREYSGGWDTQNPPENPKTPKVRRRSRTKEHLCLTCLAGRTPLAYSAPAARRPGAWLPGGPGEARRAGSSRCCGAVSPFPLFPSARRAPATGEFAWLIRASRWIGGPGVHPIHHEAPIHQDLLTAGHIKVHLRSRTHTATARASKNKPAGSGRRTGQGVCGTGGPGTVERW